MTQYVKYINNTEVQEPPQNKDGIINYNLNIEQLLIDGYKLLVPTEYPGDQEIRMYHIEYQNNPNDIAEIIVFDETQEEAEERIARFKKEQKTYEINQKIEELEKMVTDEILFNHEENVEVYREVIQGLKDTRDNL